VVYKTTATLMLPGGYQCDGVPSAKTFATPFGSGDVTFTATGSTLREEFTAHFTAGHFTAEQYPQYEQSQKNLLGAIEQNLILNHK
jgi:hypothetical protein